jgi:hypothetical protein
MQPERQQVRLRELPGGLRYFHTVPKVLQMHLINWKHSAWKCFEVSMCFPQQQRNSEHDFHSKAINGKMHRTERAYEFGVYRLD